LLDRTRTHAWGLFGGSQGESAKLLVKKKGERDFTTFDRAFGIRSATKFTRIVLKEGDEVIIESPGGGGYQPAEERTPEDVQDDVRQGYVSGEAARKDYAYKG
jgi:N-methylhydantoinase B/oxoprolinase/acetone carboxylase alpha subunit